MCKTSPGGRCKGNGIKALNKAVRKAEENIVHADKLADDTRISKNPDDITFNAERYENVAKALESSLEDINTKKIYLYAASPMTQETKQEIHDTTAHFGPVESKFLKSESDLMATGKLLKKFQDGADQAYAANEKNEEPAGQKDIAKSLAEKTYPKLYKDVKKRIEASYASKISAEKDPAVKKGLKEEQSRHLKSLDDARDLAMNDARKIYEPKKIDKEDKE